MQDLDSFVAIGDSFTEGMDDPGPDGNFMGWADRLAAMISTQRDGFRYANLAIRGKTLHEIVEEQLPLAVALKPQLVAFCGGGNDILTPGTDPDALAEVYEIGVADLRAAGSEVIVFTGFDTKSTPLLRSLRGKIAIYNTHLWSVADRYHCHMIDLWAMSILQDKRAWSEDRLHLSPEGHHRVALRAAEVLGFPTPEPWNTPWPPAQESDWMTQRRRDLKWAREHVMPWVGRLVRGESTGDGLAPKRPELLPISRD